MFVQSNPTTLSLSRHPVYWDETGSHVFKVQHTLYRLDAKALCRISDMFEDMFAMPQGGDPSQLEGTEANPIPILGVSTPEFDLFVSRAYGQFTATPSSTEILIKLLHLSRRFLSAPTREYALHSIESRKYHFHPAELIHICIEFGTKIFFKSAFARLVETPFYELTDRQKEMIGAKVLQKVAETKELLEMHRRIVASEPPIITNHADDCSDHAQCDDDWYAVWWNGMARFILDGRNPLTYSEAFKRFEVLKFGRMGQGCKQDMLKLVREGGAFRHADRSIEDVGDMLAATIRVNTV